MGTSYFTAYERAVTEFKDPTLKKMLLENTILFNETMYNYLENAIELFTNPKEARKRISDRKTPQYFENEFISDGVKTEFVLLNFPDDLLVENCIFEAICNNQVLIGSYDINTHTYKISEPQLVGSEIFINVYYIGEWNVTLYPEELYIVSQFVMACWSEYVSNDKLDIMRLLGDTDFKLTSNAPTTQAKVAWNIVNRETVVKRMNKFAWDCKYLGGVYGQ